MPVSNELVSLRHLIDRVDKRILELLVQRYDIVSLVARYKERDAVPARIPSRIKCVIDDREAQAIDLGLPPGTARAIWSAIVEQACRYEEACLTHASSNTQTVDHPE